jgi:hypothetical protein
MNKDGLRKMQGHYVRLQPPATQVGLPVDDDWIIADCTDNAVQLRHATSSAVAIVGYDGVYSYFSDPARTTPQRNSGFLQLLVNVDIKNDGKTNVVPIPPPRLSSPSGTQSRNPLDADIARLAERDYRSLWLGARAAIKYLLIVGDCNDHDVYSALAPIGLGDGTENVLSRICEVVRLVERVKPPTPPEKHRFAFNESVFTINPRFRTVLERLVAEDGELQARWRL